MLVGEEKGSFFMVISGFSVRNDSRASGSVFVVFLFHGNLVFLWLFEVLGRENDRYLRFLRVSSPSTSSSLTSTDDALTSSDGALASSDGALRATGNPSGWTEDALAWTGSSAGATNGSLRGRGGGVA